MQDRVSQYPGRIKLVPVSGQENVYDMEWADNPSVVGTPLNKASLLKDATAALFGLDETATPDNAIERIHGKPIMQYTADQLSNVKIEFSDLKIHTKYFLEASAQDEAEVNCLISFERGSSSYASVLQAILRNASEDWKLYSGYGKSMDFHNYGGKSKAFFTIAPTTSVSTYGYYIYGYTTSISDLILFSGGLLIAINVSGVKQGETVTLYELY